MSDSDKMVSDLKILILINAGSYIKQALDHLDHLEKSDTLDSVKFKLNQSIIDCSRMVEEIKKEQV